MFGSARDDSLGSGIIRQRDSAVTEIVRESAVVSDINCSDKVLLSDVLKCGMLVQKPPKKHQMNRRQKSGHLPPRQAATTFLTSKGENGCVILLRKIVRERSTQ